MFCIIYTNPKNLQKQCFIGVFIKRCSENMQQIYSITPMPNWDLNKVALQLYLNPVLASPVNLLHIFWTPFPKNTFGRLLCGCLDSNVHLWRYYLTVCKETWIFSRYCNKVIRFHWIRISIFNIPGRMKLFTESRIVWKNEKTSPDEKPSVLYTVRKLSPPAPAPLRHRIEIQLT